MVNSYCMVTRYSEVLQSLYFPAKRKCDSKIFLLNFPLANFWIWSAKFFPVSLPKTFDPSIKFWQYSKTNRLFFLIKDQSIILPPVVLFLRFLQWSHVARNLWETWKSGRKFFVCYCLFLLFTKIVMSGLLVCFVRSDLFWSCRCLWKALPCP